MNYTESETDKCAQRQRGTQRHPDTQQLETVETDSLKQTETEIKRQTNLTRTGGHRPWAERDKPRQTETEPDRHSQRERERDTDTETETDRNKQRQMVTESQTKPPIPRQAEAETDNTDSKIIKARIASGSLWDRRRTHRPFEIA